MRLDSVRRQIGQTGRCALAVVCDVSGPHSVIQAIVDIAAFGLPIAGLLNNAGILSVGPRPKRFWLAHALRDQPSRFPSLNQDSGLTRRTR